MSIHPSRSRVRAIACFLAGLLAFLLLWGFASDASAEEPALPLKIAKLDRTSPVDFGTEVMPLLKRNCLACHHKADAEGGLVLESLASLLKGGESGAAVVAKDPASSLLISRTTGHVEPLMPPEDNTVGAVPLTAEELGLLQLWIEQGATGSDEVEPPMIQWQQIPESLRSIYALDVSPDGQQLAFGRGNRVLVTDLANPMELTPLVDASLSMGPVADVDLIQSIAFSPDGTRIATGGFRTVRLWKRTPAGPSETSSQLFKFASGKFAQRMALDESGTAVAMVNALGDVELWDLATQTRRATLTGQHAAIIGLAWANASGRVLTANEAGVVAVYEGMNGKEIARLDLEKSLEQLAAGSDGEHVAVIDHERCAHLLRLVPASEQTPASIVVVKPSVADVADATAIAVLAKPTLMLAVASESRGILIVDPATNRIARTLEATAIVKTIAVTDDQTKLVAGSRDATVKVWNVADGKLLMTYQGTRAEQLSLAKATRDAARQKLLVDRLTSKTTELEDLLKKENESLAKIVKARDEAAVANDTNRAKLAEAVALVATAQAALEQATAASTESEDTSATAPEGTAATTESDAATVKAAIEKATKDLETHRVAVTKAEAEAAKSEAELSKQQRAVEAATIAQQRASDALPAHQARVQAETRRSARLAQTLTFAQQQLESAGNELADIALNADATRIVAFHRDGSTVVYQTSDGRAVAQFPPAMSSDTRPLQPRSVSQVAILDHDLVRLGRSGAMECLSLRERWELERTIGAKDDPQTLVDRVTALDFRPDGLTLAVGTGEASRSGIVKIIAVETGEVVRDLGELHTDTVLGLDFSPDGQTLASSAADRIVRLIDVASGTTIRTLEGHTHHVLSVAWQDNGRTLASAGADQSIKIWDSETGETSRTITGFSQELTSIKFVESTDQVVASCGNGQIRLANAASGATVRTFDAAKDFLFAVAVTSDGKRMIVGGQSGIVRIWNVADGALIAELKP